MVCRAMPSNGGHESGWQHREAMLNLREALELYFEDEPAPEFQAVITAPIEVRVG